LFFFIILDEHGSVDKMNINPKQMQKMMQKMGMQQTEVDATEVIIRTKDKEIIFQNPSVSKVNAMGQESWQITGEAQERKKESFNQEDIKTVMDQAGVDEQKAKTALEETNGDLAEAILQLKA
jgi:nascent polypeptide-associated complex subunit alpha